MAERYIELALALDYSELGIALVFMGKLKIVV